MQLVRVIEVGMDVSGDGGADLDPSRIYYLGQSLGGIYGTEFLAVEPSVNVGVLNVAGGSGIEYYRLSPIFRASVGAALASRMPSLLNGPGITSLDGVSVPGPFFDENMPLRDGVPLIVRLADGTERVIQSPVINTVPGAMQIQEVIEHTEWVSQSGNPVAYAPHLRRSPLAGIAVKSVIYQFAKGDQIVPNPTNTAIVRAGALADRATFYRHDLAFAENPQLPTNPHGFLTRLDILGFRAITRGAQEQIATFFASDGTFIDDLSDVTTRDGTPLFEVPIGALPEDLNFIVPNARAGVSTQVSGSKASAPLLTGSADGSPPIPDPFAAAQLAWTAVGQGSTILPSLLLLENSLDPSPWRWAAPITNPAGTAIPASAAPLAPISETGAGPASQEVPALAAATARDAWFADPAKDRWDGGFGDDLARALIG
jgi:hypothetical protein